MAFVLVQHLDPNHHSLLSEIIAKTTRISVEEAKSGTKVRPNRVYVIPPNYLMALGAGRLRLTPRSHGENRGQRRQADTLAINFFMRSLAEEKKEKGIGVVLSGTGGDGTSGLEDIKAAGGMTFAQEPTSAKYDGMPRNAIDSGCVDFILSPSQIAKELDAIRHHSNERLKRADQKLGEFRDSPSHQVSSQEKPLQRVIGQLRKTSGVDFSQYKPNTIHRRSQRRMMILRLNSLDEYAQHLREYPEEVRKLYDDILIPVTSFFRDFEAFESLKAKVYPVIVNDKANKGTIRMWAPGCSTGEETYSLAMTLLEFLGDKAANFQIQIFGTDLNEKGIEKARTGLYGENIADEISKERLQRFFVKGVGGYRVNKEVRDLCVFARHNLANDPPFSQMNLVACRNLLIYIQPALQKKIVPILHYALKPHGFLVLGGSESVSAFPDLFTVLDKKHKFYVKRDSASRLHYDFAQTHYPSMLGSDFPGGAPKREGAANEELDVQAEADRLLLKEHTPPGVIVNKAMEVVQFRGRTTPYLEQSSGKPTLNVLKLARNGLAVELRTLIAAASKKGTPIRQEGVLFEGNGQKQILNLTVAPLGKKGEQRGKSGTKAVANASSRKEFFLVLFEDVTHLALPDAETQSKRKGGSPRHEGVELKRLRRELASTREALDAAVESAEALKEEFQSANEEILSGNEELQSTNEELETSKEELQSTNEELNTLNAELRSKNSELQDLTNDVTNLLDSTRLPVVMLDRNLRIRRFTPAANKLLNVVPSDVGRSFADIRRNIEESGLGQHGLESRIAKVLESLQTWTGEVKDLEGHWHELGLLPYRTQDNKIEGVVLTLQDIDAIKIASEQMRKSSEFFRGIIDTVREPLLVLNAELHIVAANRPFLNDFHVSSEETIGKCLYEVGNRQWNIPALRTLLEQVLPQNRAVRDFEVEWDFEHIGHKTMLLNAGRLPQPNDDLQPMILLAMDDVTERRVAELDTARLVAIVESSDDAIIRKDLNGIFETWNPGAERIFGYTPQEIIGQSVTVLIPRDRADEEPGILERVRRGEHIEHFESVRRRKDGKLRDVSLTISPILDSQGRIVGASKIARDITERKLAEAALIKTEKLVSAGRLAATLAHEINNPLQAVTNLLTLLEQSSRLDTQEQEYAKMAREELNRVSHLTRQSLAFYRDSISPTAVNVEEMVESVVKVYAKRIGAKNITVTKQYIANGAGIISYPGEIRQLFTTLLINAMEAVPDGGRLALRVSKSNDWTNRPPAKGLRITLADSGCGIPTQDTDRIFEPFFTTKGENGTGLGLWVARGIAHRLGGSIRMRSSVHPEKNGTCFSVFLPNEKRE
jgi:two-component system CheB/CheR fusion protein